MPAISSSRTATAALLVMLSMLATAAVLIPPTQAGAQLRFDCAGFTPTVILANGDEPTSGNDIILGTEGADEISAGAGDDIICGLGGDDMIWGQAGDDLLLGGDGGDWLRGGDDDDILMGDAGDDNMNGGRDQDYVLGGDGNDLVRGGTGDDYVMGEAGDDIRVSGNGGSDAVFGGSGDDRLISGGPRPDEIYGGPGDDIMKGLGGADRMFGNAGNDEVRGGNQPDLLDGGSGIDSCNGGQEFDRVMPGSCETTTAAEVSVHPATDYSTAVRVDCTFDAPSNILCLKVTIPEDDTDPGNGRSVTLDVNIADNGDVEGIGPIVFLEGGPGVAPGDFIVDFANSTVDWITVAQRGTSGSQPSLNCTEIDNLFGTLAELDTAESDAIYDQAATTCSQRLRNAGVDFGDFNTEQNADDLDLIRQTLGIDQWNLLGASYGTRLGATIARDHPEGVRALLIDAVLPIEVNFFHEATFSGQFQRLADACWDNTGCRSNFGDIELLLDQAYAELNANPVTVTVTRDSGEQIDVLVDGSTLVGYVFVLMYSTSELPALPRMINDAANGDPSEITLRAVPQRDPQLFDVSEGMYNAVMCQDETFAIDLFGGPRAAACADWTNPTDARVDRTPANGSVPTLVLAGAFDPVTPPRWAAQVAAGLSNATFVEFSDQGHGASGQCFVDLFWGFMLNPGSPLNTSCADVGGPAFEIARPSTPRSESTPLNRTVFGADIPLPRPAVATGPVGQLEWPTNK